MSLQTDGVWAGGLWAPTVWAFGVWYQLPEEIIPPVWTNVVTDSDVWHNVPESGDFTIGESDLVVSQSDFSHPAWARNGILAFGLGSVVDDAVAPDGTQTMDRLVEDTSNSYHTIGQNFVLPLNQRYRWSIYVKRNATGSPRNCALQITQHNDNYIYQTFDLGSGTIGELTDSSGAVLFGAGITAVGGGVYQIYIDGIPNPENPSLDVNAYLYITLTDHSSQYAGDGASGLTVWNADFFPYTEAAAWTNTPASDTETWS